MIIQAILRRQFDAPSGFEFLADVFVFNGLIPGEGVGHGTKVAGALHIVVPAQWIRSGAGAHVVSGEQEQIGDGR